MRPNRWEKRRISIIHAIRVSIATAISAPCRPGRRTAVCRAGSAGASGRGGAAHETTWNPEGERQDRRHQPDRGRADEEPGVGAEGVVNPAAGPGAEPHAE